MFHIGRNGSPSNIHSISINRNITDFDIFPHFDTIVIADEEHDTISALVYSECGFIPAVGKRLSLPPCYQVEILEGDEKGIRKLLLRTVEMTPGEEANSDSEG